MLGNIIKDNGNARFSIGENHRIDLLIQIVLAAVPEYAQFTADNFAVHGITDLIREHIAAKRFCRTIIDKGTNDLIGSYG